MAKVFTIPAVPNPKQLGKPRTSDRRYIEGQRLLVGAMKYLAQEDPVANKEAITVLSDHFRNNFRMSDRPLQMPVQ